MYSFLGKFQINISLACNFPCEGQTTVRGKSPGQNESLSYWAPDYWRFLSPWERYPSSSPNVLSGFLPTPVRAMVYSKYRTGS